ncbi:hypothetical protein ACVPOQ_09935 [Staphylococcus aureus]
MLTTIAVVLLHCVTFIILQLYRKPLRFIQLLVNGYDSIIISYLLLVIGGMFTFICKIT